MLSALSDVIVIYYASIKMAEFVVFELITFVITISFNYTLLLTDLIDIEFPASAKLS